MLGGLLLAALVLRLHGLEDRVLGHPENYAPGIIAPGWASYPPPSTELKGVLKGLLVDAHPPLYSLGLFAWTELAGGSLFSLRIPSVVLGVLAVLLLFRVASARDGSWVGCAAAALLTFHGHHVFWSQLARMYALLGVTSLLSTGSLLALQRDNRPLHRWTYVLSTALLFGTHLYAWPLVFAQMVWCLIESLRGRHWNALRPQAFAILLGLPVFPLLIFQAPSAAWFQVPWEYAELGYAQASILPFFGEDAPAHLPHFVGIMLTAVLVGLGLLARTRHSAEDASPISTGAQGLWTRASTRALLIAAVAMTLALIAFAEVLPRRDRVSLTALRACAALPALVVGVLLPLESWLGRRLGQERASGTQPRSAIHPAPLLATLPFGLLLLASLHRDAIAARGTIAFLPYLLWSVALGLETLRPHRRLCLTAAAGLALLAFTSLRFFKSGEACPRDYRSATETIRAGFQEGDRIFVRNDILQPPLFFGLQDHHDDLVHGNWKAAIEDPATRRVWVPRLEIQTEHPELESALIPWDPQEVIEHHGITVALYVPRGE